MSVAARAGVPLGHAGQVVFEARGPGVLGLGASDALVLAGFGGEVDVGAVAILVGDTDVGLAEADVDNAAELDVGGNVEVFAELLGLGGEDAGVVKGLEFERAVREARAEGFAASFEIDNVDAVVVGVVEDEVGADRGEHPVGQGDGEGILAGEDAVAGLSQVGGEVGEEADAEGAGGGVPAGDSVAVFFFGLEELGFGGSRVAKGVEVDGEFVFAGLEVGGEPGLEGREGQNGFGEVIDLEAEVGP